MAIYNGIKVLSVVRTQEVEVEYYVGVATLETANELNFTIPTTINVGGFDYPILENTKTSIVSFTGKTEVKAVMQSVDLGTLDWKVQPNGYFATTIPNMKLGEINSSYVGATCSNYPVYSNLDRVAYEDKGINYGYEGGEFSIRIKDTSITTDDLTAMKSGLSGVILTYETPESEIVNTNVRKITSQPYNLFDGEWKVGALTNTNKYNLTSVNFIPVFGGKTYYFANNNYPANTKSSGLYVYQFNENQELIKYDNIGHFETANVIRSVVLEPNTRFVKIMLFINNYDFTNNFPPLDTIYFGLDSKGIYKPHKEPQSIVVNCGELNGVGSAQDRVDYIENEDGTYKAVRTNKIGVVDLGTLTWWANSAGGFSSNALVNIKYSGTTIQLSNIRTSKYPTLSLTELTNGTFGIALRGSNDLWVKDSNYTDATTFQEAMAGVMLYYELAEPTTKVIAEGLTFDEVAVACESGGTIAIDSDNIGSSSFAFAVRRFKTGV